MNENNSLFVSCSPHVRAPQNTRTIMLWVIIALMPTLIAGTYLFGAKSLYVTVISVASCVFFEWGYRKLMKKSNTIGDLSAVVTGLLLALSISPAIPAYIIVIGAFFAIVVVKQLYGGIGKNFLNPALAARAFLLASYAGVLGSVVIDGVTTATPLYQMYNGVLTYSISDMFMGVIPGAIGEVCTLGLLVGGIYLIIKGVISWRIPVSYLGTVALIALFCGHSGFDSNVQWMIANLVSGGVMLGAFFMATDYATSPVTGPGQYIYGFGCGALTMLIRYFGGYPEGVTYAILIMNTLAWAIDKGFKRKQFGAVKVAK